MMGSEGTPFVMNVEPSGSGNGNNGGAWGGDGSWWIILFLIFAMFGWGGFGGYGNNGSTNGAGFQGYATRADISEGFAMNNLDNGIRDIQAAICTAKGELQNALQSGFSDTQMSMMQGFNGVQSQICQLGYQLQECCCNIKTMIQEINYNMAMQTNMLQNTMNTNTRDQMDNTNNGIRAIMDKLCQMEYNGLNDKYQAALAENQSLKTAQNIYQQNAYLVANNEAQTAELIRRLGMDCPVNAVVVQPNTPVSFPTNCCGQFNGWGNNCGGCGNC